MQRDTEPDSRRLDALDLLIRLLIQHEENLDELTQRLEALIGRLEDNLLDAEEKEAE